VKQQHTYQQMQMRQGEASGAGHSSNKKSSDFTKYMMNSAHLLEQVTQKKKQ